MPYRATVYRILIVLPGDMTKERQAICEAIDMWNSTHSHDLGVVLLPAGRETASTPAVGDGPQTFVSTQTVKLCDVLVGAFWTMTGTRSGADHAGTVQEIDEFRNSGKPVLLYFSSVPVVSGSVDPEEYKSLLQFKSACRRHGLTEDYGSIPELREKLLRHLTGAVKDAHREPGSVPTPLQFPAKIVFKGAPPESRLEEEKIRILQTIAQIEAQRGGPVEAAKLSALLHMSVPRVRFHLAQLENEEYVHGSYWAPEYGLDQKGQDYLVKSKLLGRVPHG